MARYSIVKRHRDYYKYGTEPNAKIVGSFGKIEKNIASGFSTSNYLSTTESFNPEDKPWEMLFRVRTGADITTVQYFIGRNEVGKYNPFLGVYKSSWLVNISSDGKSWNVANQPSMLHTIKTNTWYVVKYGWDGSKYYLKTSEDDGISFIDSWSIESTAKVIPASLRIGAKMNSDSSTTSEPFLGSIDLSQSYINIDGERWWSGDSYTLFGSWIDDGIVSGFSSANYLRVPTGFNHGGNSWEIVCKLITGSDVTTINQYMTTNSNQGISLLVENSHFNVNLSSNGSSFDIAGNVLSSYTVLPNTEYWVKVWFDGEVYRFSYSLDGKVYNTDIEVISSTKIYNNGVLNIGVARLVNQPWLGAIDLSQSYIKINNKMWWYGTKAVIVPSSSITDFGSTKYFKNVVTTKYWKEITTGSKELAYAYYTGIAYGLSSHYYAKAPVGADKTVYYSGDASYPASSIDGIKAWSGSFTSVTEETVVIFGDTLNRNTTGDLYKDTTVTETVEGTPDDYTYTTEEIVPVEVTANDEYDFTEFVPSAEFDYYEDRNKLYNLTRRKRYYYKYVTEAFDFVRTGTRSNSGWQSVSQGSNYLYGTANAYEKGQNAGTSLVWTYQNTIPASTYTFNIKTSGQGNGYFHNPTVTVTYDDGTTEVVYTKSWSGVTLSEDFTFVASKPIKAIKATGTLSHSSISYVVVNLTLTSLTHIVGQATTEEEADYYTDRNVPYNFVYNTYEVISETFNVSNELQTYVVPEGVDKLNVVCVASRGTGNAGAGGSVKCDLSVTEGQTLYVMVGGIPTVNNTAVYNASDVRINGTELENRIIVAGGGGTGVGAKGGAGGGLTGGNAVGVGYQAGAFGGTQTAGGGASYRSGGNTDGWLAGAAGTLGMGGNGGYGSMYGGTVRGGAGGAGYYGGGGGGVYDINKVGITHAGGGGGSSYTDESLCSNVFHLQGNNNGEGFIKISYIKEIYK